MRRAMVRMASTLSAGQTLVGRTGTSYRLQKILYEREENQEIKHRLWLALYLSPIT